MASQPTLEMRRRIEALLVKQSRWPGLPLQTWRSLAVLERLGTSEARNVLEKLAGGAPEARLTQEARAALQRLRQRGLVGAE